MTGLHILIVPSWWPSPEQPISGIFCTDYARVFAEAGARVGVVFPDLVSVRHLGSGTDIPWAPRLLYEDWAGVPVVRIRGLHTACRIPALQMRRFRRWLRRGLAAYRTRYGRPDVLHAMCAIPAAWACETLDDPLARRVVVTEHTGRIGELLTTGRDRAYARAGLAGAAAVVAVSEPSRQDMLAAGIDRHIAVVPNPVTADFAPAPPPAVQRDADGRAVYRAIFVGRVTGPKGIPELIDAAVALEAAVALAADPRYVTPSAGDVASPPRGRRDQGSCAVSGPRSPGADATVSPIRRRCHAPADPRSAIEWHIVGPGPLEDLVRTRFAAAGLQHRLVMHGFRPKSDVARLIRQSHFLVLPSHAENCPLAICEALSIGRPVVASDVAGCRALVGDDDGILARAGDADSLKDAVIRLLSNYAAWDWQAIAQRARARFSGEAVASCYAGIFRHVGTPASNVG